MAHLAEPRFAPAVRKLTPPPAYALVWRATLSAAGLFAQLGATVPTRGFHLAYSPGFRSGIPRQLNGASPGSHTSRRRLGRVGQRCRPAASGRPAGDAWAGRAMGSNPAR
jgi:hypothetical protein